jgi:hypothetical protein
VKLPDRRSAPPAGSDPAGAAGTGSGQTPGQPPAGFDSPAFQKAQTACASLRPAGGFGGGGFGGGANSAAFDAYRSCLKDHGVDLPTRGAPGASTTTVPDGGTTTTIDRNSPAFQAAAQACDALRPQGGPGGTPGAGESSTTVAG